MNKDALGDDAYVLYRGRKFESYENGLRNIDGALESLGYEDAGVKLPEY